MIRFHDNLQSVVIMDRACRGGQLTVYLLVVNTLQWGRYWYLHSHAVRFYRTPAL